MIALTTYFTLWLMINNQCSISPFLHSNLCNGLIIADDTGKLCYFSYTTAVLWPNWGCHFSKFFPPNRRHPCHILRAVWSDIADIWVSSWRNSCDIVYPTWTGIIDVWAECCGHFSNTVCCVGQISDVCVILTYIHCGEFCYRLKSIRTLIYYAQQNYVQKHW